ncbi:MAG: lysylphosphatidylglycerol synthase domain-containing protein [Acidimicrobiia bacterium]|nr:lysylphosphatidylglycerol synthase domain-containing protein [Acidimicrobiia bacterium]
MTEGAEQSRSRTIVQIVVGVVVLVILFGFVLPLFIDYELVFEAMRSLEPWQIATLLALALIRLPIESSLYTSCIPGLSFGGGLRSYLASNTVADLAPPPADLAVRFGMYKTLGVGTEAAGVGIILSGFFSIGARLVLPVIALLLVVATGPADETTWVLMLLGAGALLGGGTLIFLILRSEQFTYRVGSWVGRVAERVAERLGREVDAENLGTLATGFRGRLIGTLRSRWPHASLAVIGSHVMGYSILLASMRFVGISAEQIDAVDLLVAYAIVRLITLIPITPGGIGVAAAGYIIILGAGQDQALSNLIGAASFITRIFVWLVPLLIGIVPLLGWRRRMRVSEPESETAE